MEDFKDVLVSASEFIKDRLYFVTLRTEERPKSTPCTHYFSIDNELCYESFICDFGPLNISMLYHYCMKLKKKLKAQSLLEKRIVHYTTCNKQKRLNSAYLIACYSIIYLDYTPQKAYDVLQTNNTQAFIEFRDASVGAAYNISLLDCLKAIHRALKVGFFDFDSFDYLEYEHYECVENGDLNWIVPEKFIAFCGPHNKAGNDNGYPLHSPERYFAYFRRHNVTTIIRLNAKIYDSNKFINAGFDHRDLYFVDGSTPSDKIMREFIDICESTPGAVAVHCKAGLGRTGTLIGCYIMKHYRFTALETIAWIRICRPGSIIGHQQQWLESKQAVMWKEGDLQRRKLGLPEPTRHQNGIYSFKSINNGKEIGPKKDTLSVSGIMEQVDTMKINDKEEKYQNEKSGITQGDKLNQIKAMRHKARASDTQLVEERRLFRSRVVRPLEMKTTKLGSIRTAGGSSSTRVLTKRNETNDTPQLMPRRSSQRKVATALIANGKPKLTEVVTKRLPKKKENVDWLVKEHSIENDVAGTTKPETKSALCKRGKRTLTEKFSPRSVKILKRSQAQSSMSIVTRKSSKLHLPLVKVTKT